MIFVRKLLYASEIGHRGKEGTCGQGGGAKDLVSRHDGGFHPRSQIIRITRKGLTISVFHVLKGDGEVDDAGQAEKEGSLLVRWTHGDRAAGQEFVGVLLPGIYGLCRRILGCDPDAEDAAQETFARLCAGVRREEPIKDVRKWAATVAMNVCFDIRRRRGREVPVEDVPEVPGHEAPLESQDAELVLRRMAELPERYRMALDLRFAVGLKPREIAEVLGIEGGTARVLLHNALSALRKKVLG